MKIDNPTDPAVQKFFGGDILLKIPFIEGLINPSTFMIWIVSVVAILPWIVSIACIFVILINAAKWTKSSGNEKEVESAKTGIKRALIGFASMFVLFIVANVMSYFFIGDSLDKLGVALSPCRIYVQSTTVSATVIGKTVFEYSRSSKISLPDAIKVCGY